MHLSARRSHILGTSPQPNRFFETVFPKKKKRKKLRLRGSFVMKFDENLASTTILKDHSSSVV